ncbi:c-type cytochrome [Herbaspirillum sp. AP02]|uniref:c-type cytochrome n=1 Tax=unclassified Herbaspirillum TaxID=2624150 RepID=UPI0015D96957|nr:MULTISPECIES: c-type cytochrome [unclassified Herbaspirillum]MBG7621140.1 c-type cytochrome [Herbaspirillum sp. AP02]NZD68869.1 c-type cytochrome [Herbaspirillum sp. AP21]
MFARNWQLMLLFAVTSPVLAQQASVAQGQEIANRGTSLGVAACINCHGAQGQGNASFPRLAGSGQAYLQAQLDAFADGSRKSPDMQPFAQKLLPVERTSLAMFYSQLQPPVSGVASAAAPPDDIGAWLAARGRWVDQLPACAQCHGINGNGVGTTFPPLSGLPSAYIVRQLQAWKNGARPPGPLGLMPAIASKLSAQDMNAVAAFYAAQASAAAAPTSPQDADGTIRKTDTGDKHERSATRRK